MTGIYAEKFGSRINFFKPDEEKLMHSQLQIKYKSLQYHLKAFQSGGLDSNQSRLSGTPHALLTLQTCIFRKPPGDASAFDRSFKLHGC